MNSTKPIFCVDNVIASDRIKVMNMTIQIRIDKNTKEKAQKSLKNMGMDLSSGIKYFLNQVGKSNKLSYVCDFGYPHIHSLEKLKEYNKETEWAKKYGKRFFCAKELLQDILSKK